MLSLHRRGPNQTDQYGSDIAVTLSIERASYLKTALLQLKRTENDRVELRKDQINDASAPGILERSFAVGIDPLSRDIRISPLAPIIPQWSGRDTVRIDPTGWSGFVEWLVGWVKCDVGTPSRPWAAPVEVSLQSYAPPGTEPLWGVDMGATEDVIELVPVSTWIRFQVTLSEPVG